MTSSGTRPRDTSPSSTTNHAISATEATMIDRLSQWRPGSVSGEDDIRPLSLAHATTDPVKVTAPMKTPRKTSMSCAESA